MSIGVSPDKALIDQFAGDISRRLNVTLNLIGDMKYFLDGKSSDDLIALGYTGNEVAVLKSAFSDLDQLRTIYEGSVNLAVAKDFRTFARQVFGFGLSL